MVSFRSFRFGRFVSLFRVLVHAVYYMVTIKMVKLSHKIFICKQIMSLFMKCLGGGGYSTNVYVGRLCPEVQPLTLYIPFFM